MSDMIKIILICSLVFSCFTCCYSKSFEDKISERIDTIDCQKKWCSTIVAGNGGSSFTFDNENILTFNFNCSKNKNIVLYPISNFGMKSSYWKSTTSQNINLNLTIDNSYKLKTIGIPYCHKDELLSSTRCDILISFPGDELSKITDEMIKGRQLKVQLSNLSPLVFSFSLDGFYLSFKRVYEQCYL